MRRFIVLSPDGSLLRESDVVDARVEALLATGAIVACRVDSVSMARTLHWLVVEHQERLEAAIARRAWKEQRWAQDPCCDFCGEMCSLEKATVDHRVPKSAGGADTPANWLLACYACNQKKGRKSVEQFFRQISSARAFAELAQAS